MPLFATTRTRDASEPALGLGDGLGLGERVGVAVGVGVGLGVRVGVAVGEGLAVRAGEADGVGEGDAVGAAVAGDPPVGAGVVLPPPPQADNADARATQAVAERRNPSRISSCVGLRTARLYPRRGSRPIERLHRSGPCGSIQTAEDAGPSRRASVEERPGSIGQGAG